MTQTKNSGVSTFLALSERDLQRAVRELCALDPDLQRIYAAYGNPPMWERPAGFPTLVYIILEQQVSLASAKAAYDRLCAAVVPLSPRGFLRLNDEQLKTIGFSRQKMRYCRILARTVEEGALDIQALEHKSDEEVIAELTAITGIGAWTAECYLLGVLRRPDIWPVGDLALAVAAQKLKGLPTRPKPQELVDIGAAWRPWRAVAARMLWHYYLSGMEA